MGQDLVRRVEPIIGRRDEVAMAVRTAHLRGRLLCDLDEVRYFARADGTYMARVPMLLPVENHRPSLRKRWREWNTVAGSMTKALLFGLFVVGTIVSLLFALGFLLSDAVAKAAPFLGFMALFVLLILAAALVGRSGGHGGHDGYGFHWTKCK